MRKRPIFAEILLNMSSNCNNRHDYRIEYVVKRMVQHIGAHGGPKIDRRFDKSQPILSLEKYVRNQHFCTLQELDMEVERRHASR